MARCRRGYGLGRFVFGLALVLVGLLFTLDNLHVVDAHDYFKYWPVLLIAYGLARAFDPYRPGGRFFGLVVLGAGVLFLLKNLGSISWDVWDLWPLLLALLGLSIISQAIFGRSLSGRRRHDMRVIIDRTGEAGTSSAPAASTESSVDIHTLFGGDERVISAQDFRGGKVNVVMGSCKLDLRQASIAGDRAVLEVQTVLGGVEIRVPEDWRVVLHTNSVLGGVQDSTHKPAPSASKTLVITGETVLGGIEVSN